MKTAEEFRKAAADARAEADRRDVALGEAQREDRATAMRYEDEEAREIDALRARADEWEAEATLREKLPKSIVIMGRRWFQRTYGNTYHTATIIVDGKTVHHTGRTYGYGDQYLETACQWLEQNGVVPTRENRKNGKGPAWYHLREDLGIALVYSATDVARQKDL